MTSVFLGCTVIGMIPKGVSGVTRMTPGNELYLLEKIARVQPLVKGDAKSAAVLTFVTDSNMPEARLVLQETYGEITDKLKPVVL